MAPKKLLHDPPPALAEDSDDEHEEEDNEDEEIDDAVKAAEEEESDVEEESDDEEDNEEKKEKPPSAAKKTQSPSVSEDDAVSDGSETESENTNNSPSASDFTVKPIVSKPMKDAFKPSKKNPAAKPTTVAKSGSKRPAETEPNNPKDSKKKKAANGGGDDEDAKKAGRLWGEDDEIAILKGMIEFQTNKRQLVTHANMPAFLEFIKNNLQSDVTPTQLSDKIRRLKFKYTKKGENGETTVFSKPHESKSFDLSKKIWGVEANNGVEDNAKGSKMKPSKHSANYHATVLALPVSGAGTKEEVKNVGSGGGVKVDPDEFWAKYPCLRDSLRSDNCSLGSNLATLMIERMPLVGGSKVKDLEEKWRSSKLLEIELSAKKLALMQEQANLVLDSMKSSEDYT